jgi:hypothetical protein
MVIEVRSGIQDAVKDYGDRARQQVFLSKDALLLYYVKYYSGTDSNDNHYSGYSRTFVRVPYTAECRVCGKKIVFSGDLRKVELDSDSYPSQMDVKEAETCAREASLLIMNPGKHDDSEKILGMEDPELIRKITDAFAGRSPDIPESSDITSWRILLDRYLIEKRDHLDTADTVIQTYWFADYLARKRQDRLGVKASRIFNPKSGMKDDKVFTHKQGRCTRTTVFTGGEMSYRYELGSDKLEFSTKLPPIFSIVSTGDAGGSRQCPNCGTEVKTEDAVNGCPSCGTRFRITDYDYKVSGEALFHTKLKPGKLLLGIFGVTLLLSILISLLTNPEESLPVRLLGSVFSGGMMAILVYFVLAIPIGIFLFTRIVKNSRFSDFCKRFRKTDPQMTAEEFEAEVQSRIRTFFLSEATDNIRLVAGVQPGQFADVADVRIIEYRQLATVPNPDFQIIRAHAVLDLIRVKNGKLVREKGRYSFDVYRAAAAKTELRTDKEIFTCPSCASSLSILDGGHCKFCGNTTDLSRYGWVLGAVKAE